jgi:hypothetical protein
MVMTGTCFESEMLGRQVETCDEAAAFIGENWIGPTGRQNAVAIRSIGFFGCSRASTRRGIDIEHSVLHERSSELLLGEMQ